MSNPLRAVIGNGIRPKPTPPPSSQVLACPVGYAGSGEYQNRVVTWNVATQSWEVGGWNTYNYDCHVEAFTFTGHDGADYIWGMDELGQTTVSRDEILYANGFTLRCLSVFTWGPQTIEYEVWCPALAGRLARAHWTERCYKGPEWTWHPFQVLDSNGYTHFLPHAEPEYGSGPAKNIKSGEGNSFDVDIK